MARIPVSILLSLILAVPAVAQLTVPRPVHDFGVLHRADEPWADFVVWNRTDRPAVLFRVDNPRRTEVVFSRKTIPAGDSAVVRVQYLPESPGPFRLKMDFHASAWSKPQTLEIRGEATYAASEGTPCPDFSQIPARRVRPLIVSVQDKWSKEPVEGATIRVYQNGREVRKTGTNTYGEATLDLPLGRYFFVAGRRGQSVDTAMFVNAVNDHLLVRLPEMMAETNEPHESNEVAPRNDGNVGSVPDNAIGHENEQPVVAQASEPAERSMPPEEDGLLSTKDYKESNLVFLVDVSSSMKANGRLDLLKIAMTDLLEVLRPIDRFALIEYASTTGTIIETRGNLDKRECREAIAQLEAGGTTEGAKAINKAGRTAMSHFISDGNNQIILATDGSFNEGAADAIRLSKKYRSKQINLSVLGIRCSKFGEKEMRELAEAGGGRFVPIKTVEDAGKRLIEEIKIGAQR